MKHLLKLMSLFMLVGVVMTFSNCSEDDDEEVPTESLYQLMASNSDLSTLKGWIDADPELVSILEGTTNHTFFAPSNEAFVALEESLGSSLDLVNPYIVATVLRFHLVQDEVQGSEIANGSFPTLQGEAIIGNPDGTILTGGSNSNVEASPQDILATNGRMHLVNRALVPPEEIFSVIVAHLNKLTQPILLGADFTVLAEAIVIADTWAAGAGDNYPSLAGLLSGTDYYTVFAPTNATFYAAAEVEEGDDAATIEAKIEAFFTAVGGGPGLYGIISNHVVPAATSADVILPEDMTTCNSFTTLAYQLEAFNNTEVVPADNGVGIYFDSNGDVDCTLADGGVSLANLDAELVVSNAFPAAGNGVLHVIAGILAPPVPQ
ncbi:MAG: fasciclin domain-containing protein [Reichenbachiella sp.]